MPQPLAGVQSKLVNCSITRFDAMIRIHPFEAEIMRILAVENFRDTPLGQVGSALDQAGASVDLRRAYLGDDLPADDDGYDGLVILGGGQNALDDAGSPYLPHLVKLVRRFETADKSVLGICLGAQIIARAFGAQNRLGLPVEFGWQIVTPTSAGKADPVLRHLGQGAPLFHWHEDTFSLPPDAVLLATSAMFENQAFRIGRAVYAIQFHFEADTGLVRDWNDQFIPEIADIDQEWAARHRLDEPVLGPAADAAGAALARAWIMTIGQRRYARDRQAPVDRLETAKAAAPAS